jgi:hypothetical protein
VSLKVYVDILEEKGNIPAKKLSILVRGVTRREGGKP